MKYHVEMRETESSLPVIMKMDFAASLYAAQITYMNYRKRIENSGAVPLPLVTIYEDGQRRVSRDFQTQNCWGHYQ